LPAFYHALRSLRGIRNLDPEGHKRLRRTKKSRGSLKKLTFRGMLEAQAGSIPALQRLPPPGSLE